MQNNSVELVSLNRLAKEYMYPMRMEYDKKDFRGHQVGVLLGVTDGEGKILDTFFGNGNGMTKEQATEKMRVMLEDKSFYLVELSTFVMDQDSGEMQPRKEYYLPYAVQGHSCFAPTVNMDNISMNTTGYFKIKLEALFVDPDDCSNRYAVIDDELHPGQWEEEGSSFSILNYANFLFDEKHGDVFDSDMFNDDNESEYIEGMKIINYDIVEDMFKIDFYDAVGKRIDKTLSMAQLSHMLTSFRLIDFMEVIPHEVNIGEEKDE